MKLIYDHKTRTSHSQSFVNITAPYFGSTWPLAHLIEDEEASAVQIDVFEDLLEAFDKIGYTRDSDILGGQYDFRYGPSEYYPNFH